MKKVFVLLVSLFAMMVASLSTTAQEITITLNPGWNWISYPNAEAMQIGEALGDFVPMEGDKIRSKFGMSSYGGGRWRGAVTHFIPGWGYQYYSSRTEYVELVFAQPASNVVATATPTGITATSAVVGGMVILPESTHVFLRGVCWGTESNPDIDGDHTSDGTGIGSFSGTLEDLNPNTTYFVRAYVVSDHGLAYGSEQSFTTEAGGGSGDDHAYVDLGLPSGTLWATCNVGAETPEDYGDYFAWGETQPKDTYNWSTYQYCNGSYNTLTKYCTNSSYGYNGFTDNLTTLLPEDDAATANWGSDWRMPTIEEWQELYNNTTHTWTTQNGVNGRLFTASNGNSLFLPAAGARGNSSLNDAGSHGFYWLSSLWPSDPFSAYNFGFTSGNCGLGAGYTRDLGQNVRPVRSASQNTAPTGAINGKFTINADGDQVYFSQGNLQYIGSAATPYWKFADNQWDVLGTTTGQNSSDQNVDRDLFGWGTSGWDNGNTYYRPWDTNNSTGSIYGPPIGSYYGPHGEYDLTGSYANSDWGVYNPISNGSNQTNQWRTLTKPEWAYVFNTRTTSSGIRYAMAKVNDVNGVILLPDDWNTLYFTLNNTDSSASYSSNTITASQWSSLELHGAVFLPAAGNRSGTSVYHVGSSGYYWSASYYGESDTLLLDFQDRNLSIDVMNRCIGLSVRLARVAEN